MNDLTFSWKNDEDLTIEYRGCTIGLPFAPHPCVQEWSLKYMGIQKIGIGMTQDSDLYRALEILSEHPDDVKPDDAIPYLDRFIDEHIKAFPFYK